jgi:hypothetical protein
MDFERSRHHGRRVTSPFESLRTLLQGSPQGTSQRKLELSMRYVEHVLDMYADLPVSDALPKVVDALFAYTAVDSTLLVALVGPAASADPRFGDISYELVYTVRDRIRDTMLAHLSWRRDARGEDCLRAIELEDMVTQFTRTLRDVFSRSVREGVTLLADPATRAMVANQCLSALDRAN